MKGIYQACSLKEVEIKDITVKNEKYCHNKTGAFITTRVLDGAMFM